VAEKVADQERGGDGPQGRGTGKFDEGLGEEVTAMSDELHGVLSPLLAAHGLELVDLEVRSGLVRVTVDREGGIDLDSLASANRTVSAALDEIDPMPGRYALEVSSPGVERRLRTPEHFGRALGETVSVRTLPGTGDVRRVQGRLSAADESGFVLEGPEIPGGSLRIAYDEVERARTVFEWGAKPAPSPSRAKGAPPRPRERTPKVEKNAKTERVTTP
jgi:ribosome maturation factor RimP